MKRTSDVGGKLHLNPVKQIAVVAEKLYDKCLDILINLKLVAFNYIIEFILTCISCIKCWRETLYESQ